MLALNLFRKMQKVGAGETALEFSMNCFDRELAIFRTPTGH
jgi:hypothetical protein